MAQRFGRRELVLTALALAVLLPRPAAADVTLFLGLTPTPDSRPLRGGAFGFGLLIVGFEFEYASVVDDESDALPSLQTGMGNVLIQAPIEVGGITLYGTAGGGLYRERLASVQETNIATNIGGGAKVRVAGPLRLRLDYRLIRLRGDALYSTYQRFYAGANLGF